MKQLRVREGDFIETPEGLIFDVKGVVHPPDRAIAFLRYYPSLQGTRVREGTTYAKVYDLAERFNLLQQQFPHYLFVDPVAGRELQGVPINRIQQLYQPVEQLQYLRQKSKRDPLEQVIVGFANRLQREARIKAGDLGVSGSVQIGLHGPESDIDLIVYGRRASQAVQLALQRIRLAEDSNIKGYLLNNYRPIYELRWLRTGVPLNTMLTIDGPKAMHGLIGHRHYFVRAVLNWDELEERYGDRTYQQVGPARAFCRIVNHRDSLFTPCRYEVDDVEWIEGAQEENLREIVSFRGRFTEQVRQDDRVVVQGIIELVHAGKERWSRFVLGEQPTDILLPRYLL
ncbi:MAG: nucleotidyltransferase domain-containing protein [Candidatus Hodarchaeota archaeon]